MIGEASQRLQSMPDQIVRRVTLCSTIFRTVGADLRALEKSPFPYGKVRNDALRRPVIGAVRFAGLFQRGLLSTKQTKEANMPILLPVLIGVPVILAGGYFIVHAWH